MKQDAHAAVPVALGTLAAMGQVPWLAAAAVALLWAWAGVSLCRPPAPARAVGWTQVLAGLVLWPWQPWATISDGDPGRVD